MLCRKAGGCAPPQVTQGPVSPRLRPHPKPESAPSARVRRRERGQHQPVPTRQDLVIEVWSGTAQPSFEHLDACTVKAARPRRRHPCQVRNRVDRAGDDAADSCR